MAIANGVLLASVFVLILLEVKSDLGADPMSLMRIVGKLCRDVPPGGRDENFASQFYNCYNLLETKEKCIFDSCQNKALGYTFSTKANIEASCKAPQALPVYTSCLMQEFKACGRDFVKAVTTINICQGKLLGLE